MFRASLCPSSGEQDRLLLYSLCIVCIVCCKCVVWCCHRVSTQLRLNKYHIISYHIWCSALVVLAVIVWSCIVSCVHCVMVTVRLHTVHTAYNPAPHNHSQQNQCRTPYAVIHNLVLLKMGIMLPETCWDRSLIINIGLVAYCWFISLHPTIHDARSQEPETYNMIS